MSGRVSLSRRDAQIAAREIRAGDLPTDAQRVLATIERGLQTSPKKAAAKKATTATKRAKKRTKAEETRAIYVEVVLRAGGRCEACGQPFTLTDPPEMDHQLGKGRGRPPQSAANCWLVHGRSCHRAKHAGRPTRRHWLLEIRRHAVLYGHRATADYVQAELDAESLVAQAEALR